jgi:hypothetical protein
MVSPSSQIWPTGCGDREQRVEPRHPRSRRQRAAAEPDHERQEMRNDSDMTPP